MKKFFGLIFLMLWASAFFVACGGEDSVSGDENSTVSNMVGEKVEVVAGIYLACDDDHQGVVVYDIDNEYRLCDDLKWVTISIEDAELLEKKEHAEFSSSNNKMESSSSVESSFSEESSSSSINESANSSSVEESAIDSSTSVEESSSSSEMSSSTEDVILSSSSIFTSYEDKSIYDATANTLTDLRDGHVYRTVKIECAELNYRSVWMNENLNYSYLQKTLSEDSSSFCYNDSPVNCEKYGRLYMWSAAIDSAAIFSDDCKGCGSSVLKDFYKPRGVCPAGWHVPDYDEFLKLRTYDKLRDNLVAGEGFFNLENLTDYSFVLGGYKNSLGVYGQRGAAAYVWMGYENSSYTASAFHYTYTSEYSEAGPYAKKEAFSVRCKKDDDFDALLERSADYNLNPDITYGKFTDSRDGYVYRTVDITDEESGLTTTWMAENLSFDYRKALTGVSDSRSCQSLEIANCERYGRLYSWGDALDSAGLFSKNSVGCGDVESCIKADVVRGICPEGWRLPTKIDLDNLLTLAGGMQQGYVKLRAKKGWDTSGDDTFGFSAVPYENKETAGGYIWSSDDNQRGNSDALVFMYDYASVDGISRKNQAFVRCIKIVEP